MIVITDENFDYYAVQWAATVSGKAAIIAALTGGDIYPGGVHAGTGTFETNLDGDSGTVGVEGAASGRWFANQLLLLNSVPDAAADRNAIYRSEESGKLSFKDGDGAVGTIQ